MNVYEKYQQYLLKVNDTGKYRKLPEPISLCKRKNYIDFSTNDYLNLSQDTEVIAAAKTALDNYGASATGSRLLSGNNELFKTLEQLVAEAKNTEDALIFTSGYQANFHTLSSLLDPNILHEKPLVFFDKYNHASLYQAALLSNAILIRYNHNDLSHLAKLLEEHKLNCRPKFIVTETLFGMDGDQIEIEEIVLLAKKSASFLYLDEAHATGIIGKTGYGLSTNLDLSNIPHLIMGTFSKALGGSGGYIACNHLLKNYLVNTCKGFIYTTASSPGVIGAAIKAWQMIPSLSAKREHLKNLGHVLRQELQILGFDIGSSISHIVPIIIKDENLAITIQRTLLQNKIIVSYVRPPTVPPGSSRLRFALNCSHTLEDLQYLIKILKIFNKNFGPNVSI